MHYFSEKFSLRSVVLPVKYMPKTAEGYTSARLVETISKVINNMVGTECKRKLLCSATDGASNVTAASQVLGGSLVPSA